MHTKIPHLRILHLVVELALELVELAQAQLVLELALWLVGIDCKSLDTSQHTSHICPPCLHTKRQHLRILKLAELVRAQELGELAKALYHNERKWRGIAYKFSP